MIEIKNDTLDLVKLYGSKKYDKWVKLYSIINNKDVIAWLKNKIDKFSEQGKEANLFSITTYFKPLQQYCDYNKTENPSDLLKEDIDARNNRVREYLMFLLKGKESEIKKYGFNKKPSEVSIKNQIQSRIKSFYSARGKNISYGMKTAKSGANIREIFLNREMIKKINAKLESPEYRLITKIQCQTGLRISDILISLTSDKYIVEKHKDHYFIRNFKTMKTGLTINYLFFTQELTETFNAVYPTELSQLDLNTVLKTKFNTPISNIAYLNRIKTVGSELEWPGNLKTHAFRKYFISQIDKCREVDDRFKLHLEGHEIGYRDVVYNNNIKNIEWYYTQWLKLESLICVDYTLIDKTDEEILVLKEKNIKLEGQVKELLKGKIKTTGLIEQLQKENQDFKEIVNKVPEILENYERLSKQNKTIMGLLQVSDKEIIETLGLKESKKGKAKKFELDNEKEENGDD